MADQPAMEWHVVRTKPHQEYLVESGLTRVGNEILCPRITDQRLIRREMQPVISPLSPGYVFARFRSSHSRMVMYTNGVRNLVSFGSAPAVVSPEVIDGIRDRLQGGVVALNTPHFSHGDVMSIQDGPLCGLEAVFEREMSGQQRSCY